MNTNLIIFSLILSFLTLIILILSSSKKENFEFSTGVCSSTTPKCPKGSYVDSCQVSFNTSDWGEHYFVGTCDKRVCKDYDGSARNICRKEEIQKISNFGFLPSDFFNNTGAYSYQNIDGNLVLDMNCVGEKSNYYKDPAGYKNWVSKNFHDYANIKRKCGDIVPTQEVQPYLNMTCNEEFTNLNKDRNGYKNWASNNQDKVNNFFLLCPGFQDAFTGYSIDTSGTLKPIFDNLLSKNKLHYIPENNSISSGDGLISQNKKWMAYLGDDGEFSVYNPETNQVFRLLQSLGINKALFQGPFKMSMASTGYLYMADKNNKSVIALGFGTKAPQGWAYQNPFTLILNDDGKVCIHHSPQYNKTAFCMN